MLVNHILWCAFVALTIFELGLSQNCVSDPPHYLCPKDANFLEVYIPHDVYCNRFYKCIRGQAVESRCQSGTFFNPVMNLCCPSDSFCVRPEPVVKQFPQCISCGQQFIYCDGRPLPRFYVCNCDGSAVERYCPWALNMCSGKNISLVFTNGRCAPDQADLTPIPIKIQLVQEVVATAEAQAFASAGVQSGGPVPPPPPPPRVAPPSGEAPPPPPPGESPPPPPPGDAPPPPPPEESPPPSEVAPATATDTPTVEAETTTEEEAPQRKREASMDILEFEAPAIEAGPVDVAVQTMPTPTTTVTTVEVTSTMGPSVLKQQISSSVVVPSNAEALTSPETQAQSQTIDAFLLVPGMSLIPSNQQLVWQVDNVPFVHTTK